MQLQPGTKVPKLYWLKITGQPGEDDFGLKEDCTLVVSMRALEALKKLNLKHCDVQAFGASM